MWVTYDAISDYWTGEGYLVIEEDGTPARAGFASFDDAIKFIRDERGEDAVLLAEFFADCWQRSDG
jgi:hypothetical protein